MASVVRMPSVLAGATEAAIANWLVAPGDTVAVGDPIAEIETEKALVEYSAEQAGVVGRIVLAEGDTGEIGAPIAVLVREGETDADIDAALGGAAPATAGASAPAAPPEADGQSDGAARSGGRWPRRHPGHACSRARSSARSPASRASTSPRSPGPARTGGSSDATWNGSPASAGPQGRRRPSR